MTRRLYQQFARGAGQGVERLLGPLEAEVMALAWGEARPLTVREVRARLNEGRASALAYTTVMTVMARLAGKGVLARERAGPAHRYRAAQGRDEFVRRASDRIVEELVADFGDAAIASFAEAIERVDPGRLAALRRAQRPGGGA